MTNAHQAYNLYMTTKKHFTSPKYDAFSNKPVRIPQSRFMYRPERYRMERLCKRFNSPKDLIQYFVSNFALETPDFLYQPEEYGDSSYVRWESYKQSLSYNFRNEVELISEYSSDKSTSVFEHTQGQIPLIVQMMITNKVSIQTVVILDSIYNFLTTLSEDDTINSLYAPHILRAQKTRGFIKFDKDSLINLARGLESKNYEFA